MLSNIVDNIEQYGQQNIVQCCLQPLNRLCDFCCVFFRILGHISMFTVHTSW